MEYSGKFSFFSLLLIHSEYIVDPTWTWGDTPWCDFIFRQNEYLSDDWWPLSPSSPYQLSQHLNGILEQGFEQRISPTRTPSYSKIHSSQETDPQNA